WLVARACRLGAARVGLPSRDRAALRGHLSQQRAEERPRAGRASGRDRDHARRRGRARPGARDRDRRRATDGDRAGRGRERDLPARRSRPAAVARGARRHRAHAAPRKGHRRLRGAAIPMATPRPPIAAPNVFVARGPYRYVRNPMYIGVLTSILGIAIAYASAWVLAYAVLVAIAFHFFVLGYEEPTLEDRFGASYREYRRTVPRWV